jgi:hypothetical protein
MRPVRLAPRAPGIPIGGLTGVQHNTVFRVVGAMGFGRMTAMGYASE